MTRRPFGGTTADFVFTVENNLPVFTTRTVTFWDAPGDGGAQYTDLRDGNGNPTSTITTDLFGFLPRFLAPDDSTIDFMWADAGGPSRQLIRAADTTLDFVQPTGRGGTSVTGNADDVISNLHTFFDKNRAPIGGTQNAGGDWMNDRRRTVWDYNGTEYWNVNIYGDDKQSYLNRAAVNGVPGNQLAFTTACFCHFEADRAPTVSDWSPYTACTIAPKWSGGPKGIADPGNPDDPLMPKSADGFNWAARLTATANGPVSVTSPSGIYMTPVVPGQPRSAIAFYHAPVTPRTCRLTLKYFTSSFAYIAGSDQQATATSSTSAWTPVLFNGTVPTGVGAAFVLLVPQADTTTLGEQHDISAVGTWPAVQTAFNRPMVNQVLSDGGLGALAGDRVSRRDGGAGSLVSEYKCVTGGYPSQQVWQGIA